MQLTRQQVYHNYNECLQCVKSILDARYSWNGYSGSVLNELAQSVVGDDQVVHSLQSELFDPDLHRPLLLERIDAIRKLLLPDLRKKQFVSVFDVSYDLALDQEGEGLSEPHQGSENLLKQALSPKARGILEEIQAKNNLSVKIWSTSLEEIRDIEQKLLRVKQFFPDSRLPDIRTLKTDQPLTSDQVIDCYKCVYIGIEPHFPAQFLQFEGSKRAAVLIRFLTEHILGIDPERLLNEHTIEILGQHKLHNIARYFNYSLNRALGNAYPNLILPWLNSRIPDNYWEEPAHRIEAVRWLVEQVLEMDPENLRSNRIKRSHFTKNGLSFLYNAYYNSVNKALQEAYPFLHRWELGSVPYDFWDDLHSAEAIQWLIARKGWKTEQLPGLIKSRKFNKKTFSEYGLATLFERKFKKNFYSALNCAFPGRFMPWELGRVPSGYWKHPQHLFTAARWIARREGISERKVLQAVQAKEITFSTLQRYSIGSALKRFSHGSLMNLYWPQFQQERNIHSGHSRLLRKLNMLIEKDSGRNKLLGILFHGFYTGLHNNLNRTYRERLFRMQKRIRRRQRLQNHFLDV